MELDFEPVRYVIVGLGMGLERARQLQADAGTEVLAVVDLDAGRAEQAARELGCGWSVSLDTWIGDDSCEVVYVMTPTGTHADIAVAALDAGRHVLTTKPMEADLAGCDRMIDAADANGRLLAVDFELRLEQSTRRIRQRLADGAVGTPLGGTMALRIRRDDEYYRTGGGWRGTKKIDGGGVMSNQAIHHIDQLLYFLGMPDRVSMRHWTQTHAIEAEDLGCATWEYRDGAVVQLYATTSYPVDTWHMTMELHGTEGTVRYSYGGHGSEPTEEWHVGGHWEDNLPEPEPPLWTSMAQNLAAAIRTGADRICDGREGRRSRLVLDRMYESAAADGAWVSVEA